MNCAFCGDPAFEGNSQGEIDMCLVCADLRVELVKGALAGFAQAGRGLATTTMADLAIAVADDVMKKLAPVARGA